ncbi:Polysaccharide pyruvyl transferase domain-containing protein [Vibrio crassostreae]|nr:Polysaccharide pyruvyl transferase domain-containing protein [Vibrio crassostreae]
MFNKYVVISGWYGPNNFGDEAILESIMQQIVSEKQEDKNTKIVVLGVKPSKTKELFPTVISCYQFPNDMKQLIRSVITLDLFKTLYFLMRAKTLYLGGGGFLSDWQSWNIGWMGQLVLAKLTFSKCRLWGVGVGPFNNKYRTRFVSFIFNNFVDDAYVRDEVSHRCLVSNLRFTKPVRVSVDPVANMDCSRYINNSSTSNARDYFIFIPAVYFKNKRFDNGEEQWKELFGNFKKLMAYFESKKIYLRVLLFQPDAEKELYKDIQLAIDGFKYVDICYSDDHRQAIQVIDESKGVISFRLHGNIIAYALKKSFLPIIYHFKAEEFLKMTNNSENPKIIVGDGVHIRETHTAWPEWQLQVDNFLSKLI